MPERRNVETKKTCFSIKPETYNRLDEIAEIGLAGSKSASVDYVVDKFYETNGEKIEQLRKLKAEREKILDQI